MIFPNYQSFVTTIRVFSDYKHFFQSSVYIKCLYSLHIYFVETPSAPGHMEVNVSERDSAIITWTAPVHDGGSPLSNYIILAKSSPMARWEEIATVPARSTQYTVNRLQDGQNYYFSVVPVNRVGAGVRTETTRPVAIKRMRAPMLRDMPRKSYTVDTITTRTSALELHVPDIVPRVYGE